MRSFFSMWIGLVAMKVCTRQDLAPFSASIPRWMSRSFARHRPATVESLTVLAIARTASKSPLDEAGKPASITSTFMRSSALAMRSFSSLVIEAPGLCSPSRIVVSKMMRLLLPLMVRSLGANVRMPIRREGRVGGLPVGALVCAREAQQQAGQQKRRAGEEKLEPEGRTHGGQYNAPPGLAQAFSPACRPGAVARDAARRPRSR